MASFEFTLKLGLELSLGKKGKYGGGASLYRNTATNETGMVVHGGTGLVSGSVSRVMNPGSGSGDPTRAELTVSLGPVGRNLTTGEKKVDWASLLPEGFSIVPGIGFELTFNRETYDRLTRACQRSNSIPLDERRP